MNRSAKRLSLKGGALAVALLLAVLTGQGAFPAPAKACTWMMGVTYTYYYSTGGTCRYDCPNEVSCWGDTSGYIVDVIQGDCWYCG
jgi:hypothetical protein